MPRPGRSGREGPHLVGLSALAQRRHNAREALGLAEHELLVLTELLLRGPQTAAELRTHASRMRPLESVEAVQEALRTLLDRPEPLVQRIPGGRVSKTATASRTLTSHL